jgi:hypothetical protein
VGRTAARLIALVALLAGAAAIAAVLLAASGGGGGSGGAASTPKRAASSPHTASTPHRAKLPHVAPVRNASEQADWAPYSGAVPILRYHAIGVAPSDETYTELFVTPADFRAQLDWLAEHDYEAVGLETVEHAWFDGGTLPAKPIVLSFDGVDAHLLDVAVPTLSERGWPADLVVDPEAGPLRTGAVARLIALGWDVEPSGEDPAAARRLVRARLPTPARNFAFRQGESAAAGTAALEAAGYVGATATGGGFAEASRPFDLPRITIFNASRIEGFEEAIQSHGNGVGA